MKDALLLFGIAPLLFASLWALLGVTRARRDERIVCPANGKEADVVFQRVRDEGPYPFEKLDVVCCSLLPNPEKVTCSKLCARVRSGTASHRASSPAER